MKAYFAAEVKIENPTADIIQWCRDNLQVDNPEYEKKVRMNLWLGNTPKKLALYKIIDGNVYLPAGMRSKFSKIPYTELYPEHRRNHFILSDNFIPYDYQSKASKALISSEYGGILVSAAGSGKTSIGIMSMQDIGGKHIWIAHTKDLLDQAKARFIEFYGKDGIGVTTGGKLEIGMRVTFATIQTLNNIDVNQYANEFDVVWCDECHRVCGTPTKLQMWQKVLSQLNAKRKYGMTATLHRADGLEKCVTALLGEVIHEIPKSATENRTLKPTIVKVELPTPKSDKYLDTDGTIIWAKLINYLCYDSMRTRLIADDIFRNGGKSILVLSDRTDQLHEICNLFTDNRFVAVVTGSTKKDFRESAMRDMRDGKLRILLSTYQLAKEGLDIPRLDTLCLVSPNKDYAIITQAVGRIQRLFEGKDKAVVRDYVDVNIIKTARMYIERCKHYRKLGASYDD